MLNTLFARVEGNEIVQFPVTIDIINERNNPKDVYYPCYFPAPSERPTPALEEKVVQVPRILGVVVYVEEKLVKKSVEEMFDDLHALATSYDENEQPYLDLTKITPAFFNAFEEIVKIKVQASLDAFAQERGYDDLRSICTYATSTNQTYLVEAQRAAELRDLTWPVLFNYMEGIKAGTTAIPTSWADVQPLLPELTWSNIPR